jgi:hypothetical protein
MDKYISNKAYKLFALNKIFASAAIMTTVALSISGAPAIAYTLTNGSDDASVTVGVDGYGSFGISSDFDATDAIYNPIGPITSGQTTFESGVAIRFGNSGERTFLTTDGIGSSGFLPNLPITGTATTANSSFSFEGLTFNLTQTLDALFSGSTQTGSVLTQSYTIANTTNNSLNFDLTRYFDGDLLFDGSRIDGGGHLIVNGTQLLFATDTATGSSASTTFIGITAQGGTSNGYEIDSFDELTIQIISGAALDNIITGDGTDADQFIDAGNGYDVAFAFNNLFSLGAGQTTSYTTQTFFGSAPPNIVNPNPESVPEPASVLGLLVVSALGATSKLKRKQGQKA